MLRLFLRDAIKGETLTVRKAYILMKGRIKLLICSDDAQQVNIVEVKIKSKYEGSRGQHYLSRVRNTAALDISSMISSNMPGRSAAIFPW